MLKENAKALIAFLTALGTWGATASADGIYEQQELWSLCGVAVTALGVWVVPNQVRIRRNRPLVADRKD